MQLESAMKKAGDPNFIGNCMMLLNKIKDYVSKFKKEKKKIKLDVWMNNVNKYQKSTKSIRTIEMHRSHTRKPSVFSPCNLAV